MMASCSGRSAWRHSSGANVSQPSVFLEVILDQVLAFSEGMLQDDLAILTLRLRNKRNGGEAKKKSFTQEKHLG